MPAGATRLTQSFVNGASAGNRPRARFWDAAVPGLVLNVTSKGAKSYCAVYRDAEGRQREPRIGDARIVTLDQARGAALQMLAGAQLHGMDPVAERRSAKLLGEQRRTRTFEKLSDAYFAMAQRRKAASRMNLEKIYDRKHLRPRFLQTPVSELSAEQLAKALDEIAEKSGNAAANTSLQIMRQMLNFAIEREWINANPVSRLKQFPTRSRERVAHEKEIKEIWSGLTAAAQNARSDARSAALALQIALLTLQRRGEVAGLHWREIDWKGSLWTIPGPRTKNKKGPHLVPLSDAAIRVLRAAFEEREDGFAFTARSDAALDAKVMTRAFARLTHTLGIDDLTVHDLRRTGATMLTSERLGVMGEIVSRILNHTPPGPAITLVYNRNTYLPQKRAALEAWAEEVARLSASG